MGVVYRARYVVDNRHVAVKLLPPNIANEMILSRFERELEILNTLRHPHIVRCFGGVCEGNQHFYAMELVEGGTLDHLLEERGQILLGSDDPICPADGLGPGLCPRALASFIAT